jgi:hypothetical protein
VCSTCEPLKVSAGEQKVITMEMIGKVWEMKLRDEPTNSEISKRTGL